MSAVRDPYIDSSDGMDDMLRGPGPVPRESGGSFLRINRVRIIRQILRISECVLPFMTFVSSSARRAAGVRTGAATLSSVFASQMRGLAS